MYQPLEYSGEEDPWDGIYTIPSAACHKDFIDELGDGYLMLHKSEVVKKLSIEQFKNLMEILEALGQK